MSAPRPAVFVDRDGVINQNLPEYVRSWEAFRFLPGAREAVRRLNEAGSTIIAVTHTMWVVAEYAHRAVVMKDGRVALFGTVREVFAQEEKLREAALRPPHIVSLGDSLGHTVLSVEEMVRVTEGG